MSIKGGGFQKNSKASEEIPASSLADIAFLLLIFFMVTTVFQSDRDRPIEWPEAEAAQKIDEKQKNILNIWMERDGSVYINDQPHTMEQVTTIIAPLYAASERALVISVRGDREVPYRYMNQVQDALVAAGVVRVVFATQLEQSMQRGETMTAEAIPATESTETANDRLKRSFSSWFWGSMTVATVVHFAAFAFWPELTAEDFSFDSTELEAIELPPEIEIPPPPQQISRPATPIMAAADIEEDITIAPTTFEDNPVEDLPPPPEETTGDISAAPTFTPFTVAPSILNRNDVVRAMEREYPPLLRDAGIGGTVRVYFFIDEDGRVGDRRIDQSSGHQALDDAAMAVSEIYQFSPALNRDKKVPVWVSFPITFQVR